MIEEKSSLVPASARRTLWIALACWLALNRLPPLLDDYRDPIGSGQRIIVPDFFQDYASARNVLEGRPAYTDHNAVARNYLNREVGHLPTFTLNAHPPGSIPVFLPFALVGFTAAFAGWGVVCEGLLARPR